VVRRSRISVIHLMLAIFAVVLIGQAAKIQLVQGHKWAERARRQHFRDLPSAAARGDILDATGKVLVESRQVTRLTVAPPEVRDTAGLARALHGAGFPSQWIAASIDARRKWVELPGLHITSDVASLAALAGVHAYPVMKREYANTGSIRPIVGRVDLEGRGIDGIELVLDSLLRGDSSITTVARDSRGRRLDSPGGLTAASRPGHNVTLTINRDLQEICERALRRAADSLHASGGDIVVMNPFSGEVLAMVSRRPGAGSLANTAVSEPFEPGSTLKPFIAAALLQRGRARSDETIETFNGELVVGGRRITDAHKAPALSLADVIRFSSNVGIVRFAERLTARETFETLRDLGLGTATGIPLPAEADGTLREPARWNRTSAASMVMGYELAVTPLQLVVAYSAIANGGELIEPHVVKEIRSRGGDLIYHAKPRVVRRVLSPEVAREVQRMLLAVVSGGTAMKADLATYQLGGKSGTARRTMQGRGYVAGNYTASFVGLFPGDRPQYVVLVKLDSPRGAYAGGEVAAPVTAVVLRAALAAQDAALDRQDLAMNERRAAPDTAGLGRSGPRLAASVDTSGESNSGISVETALLPRIPRAEERTVRPARTIRLPFVQKAVPDERFPRPVPEVAGLPVRDAVRALHNAGFRVRLVTSQVVPTAPAAGSMLSAGGLVKLQHNH